MFVLQLYPYASVYLGAEGMLGGEARDRVAGFWRALHLAPPAEPDHLAALLGLYAGLLDREAEEPDVARRALWVQARRALLWEHLLTWLPPYLHRLQGLAEPAYGPWARMLEQALLEEASTLPVPDNPLLHLRGASTLADPRAEGGEAFLTTLLAPVRTGIVLVRADLADAARQLGLGLRQGERRYALEAMLSQDGRGTVSWLADLAQSWTVSHQQLPVMLEPIRTFWLERAAGSGTLLRELAAAETV